MLGHSPGLQLQRRELEEALQLQQGLEAMWGKAA